MSNNESICSMSSVDKAVVQEDKGGKRDKV